MKNRRPLDVHWESIGRPLGVHWAFMGKAIGNHAIERLCPSPKPLQKDSTAFLRRFPSCLSIPSLVPADCERILSPGVALWAQQPPAPLARQCVPLQEYGSPSGETLQAHRQDERSKRGCGRRLWRFGRHAGHRSFERFSAAQRLPARLLICAQKRRAAARRCTW